MKNLTLGEIEKLIWAKKDAQERLWGGWSATTGRHIAAFCGMNKKEFTNLPLAK